MLHPRRSLVEILKNIGLSSLYYTTEMSSVQQDAQVLQEQLKSFRTNINFPIPDF